MSELLPCPFCGSKNTDPGEWMNSHGETGPGCSDCGATGPSATRWNTRHTPEGWQAVPVSPTAAMKDALYGDKFVGTEAADEEGYWASMLEAAPKPGGE